MTPDGFRRLALSMPESTEVGHMGHPDFRAGGKIFATLGYPDEGWGMVKLTPDQQEAFVSAEPDVFVPVKGGWGRGGATTVCLRTVKTQSLRVALAAAWRGVAPRRLLEEEAGPRPGPGGETDEVARLLAPYPPAVQAMARRARGVILKALPGIAETVDHAAKIVAYGHGPGYRGMVCTLIPSRSGVKLGLYRGTELPDPGGLLQGKGRVHRHVPLGGGAADPASPGVKRLLTAAARACKQRLKERP